MFDHFRSIKTPAILGVLAITAGFGYYVSLHPMDFRVYHYGAIGVFDGTRPVYGPSSGLGWPMHYRYPPLFLLLFSPLTLLPLEASAAVWVGAKIGVLLPLMRAIRKRVPITLLSFLLIAPYLIEEFRYGNAQFFVLALTIAALLILRRQPVLAGASLGLAISLKVWPLFFVPYLAVRREWKPVGWTLGFVLLLLLVPSIYFGLGKNFDLLAQWVDQEVQTQLSESEIWFPNQSLRGMLMRYLTIIDYSQVPDSNYPQINLASLNPTVVRGLWLALAAGIYVAFLFLANRNRESTGWLEHGLAFCLIALLEPFTQKYALVILLWPATSAGILLQKRLSRILVYGAVALVLVQPLVPGATAQRLVQVLGMDFAATTMLALAVLLAVLSPPRAAGIAPDKAPAIQSV